ncbi:MAG TPA: ATP-dependent helicase [Candidatus Polarisedimenticolaceae bacterium]|nr:ATP-dependent helicase [Candidatus Polarisedimenticolaceae bacterium]
MAHAWLSVTQQLIVDHGDGPLLVVAGPGSGKTRVLTERVRRLANETGHFRVLALTFTNKAANEMRERLQDLGSVLDRVFIGTLHGFCLTMLSERGKHVGVSGSPQLFEHWADRKGILMEAVAADPLLTEELMRSGDAKARSETLDRWLRGIALIKAHPISQPFADLELNQRIMEAYNAGLRACNAYDFEDLLLLSYRLLTEYPKVADFYRRLFKYVCIDEAQDLNEAQYAVLTAMCGDEFKNVMMVGDPKQSIYGFNTASPKFMDRFAEEFNAATIELKENFRSSKAIVRAASSLQESYSVSGQLPIAGELGLLVGENEENEASLVVAKLKELSKHGHRDVEGSISWSRCAVLARTRFALLHVEKALKNGSIPYYKRVSVIHENESKAADSFQLGMRLIANPKDRFHLAALLKKWDVSTNSEPPIDHDGLIEYLRQVVSRAKTSDWAVSVEALAKVVSPTQRLDIKGPTRVLRAFADSLGDDERQAIYDDTEVLLQEWDTYLRASAQNPSVAGFLSALALGTTQQRNSDGVALLTVHSAKGLEFEVVCLVGMAEGIFPDYRAKGSELDEERRNAFVGVTRSKRLLYCSYPKSRRMPWGDARATRPSPYLKVIGLVQ